MATEDGRAAMSSSDVPADVSLSAPPLPPRAWHALHFGLLLSACRCTLQYVVFPFALPWIGVTTAIPPWVTLVFGVLALGALARNVRYLWHLRHPRRWNYLLLALVVALALLVFVVVDLHALVLG